LEQITINNGILSLTVIAYGAIIQKLIFTGKNGRRTSLVVGLDRPEDYFTDKSCLGACVGRYAGRISGSFHLHGKEFPLHTVVKDVHLHGGREGFYKKIWKVKEVLHGENPRVVFSYHSPHMEEGYPGALDVLLTYELSGNTLVIDHKATADRTTVVNLVNHSYFLLDDSPGIAHYRLQLHCREYLETHKNLLPTGNILPVEGTPYDFLEPRPLGEFGLDTPFVIASETGDAANLFSPDSGIRMKVNTNQPSVVVYTPPTFAGICFETQNFPDAPNHPHFPSSILEPGQTYHNISRFTFESGQV
jgi:aldose 1-epimerase